MRGRQTPAVVVDTVQLERLDDEWFSVELNGTWRDVKATSKRLMLIVDAHGGRHRFPAVPRPRPAAGAPVLRFEARFNVPASLREELAGRMTLMVGDAAVALPALVHTLDRSPEAPAEAAGDAALVAPLREELAERVRIEARLRTELAALRARADERGPVTERLEAARRELADEIVRVRQAVQASEARRQECDALRGRVAELEAELIEERRQAEELRTAELSARAGREAAVAEAVALRDELERLAAGGLAAEASAGELELERAETLLAEARALTDSLG
jgi:hypothetical protein